MIFEMWVPFECLSYQNVLRVTTTNTDNHQRGDKNPAIFIKSKYEYQETI